MTRCRLEKNSPYDDIRPCAPWKELDRLEVNQTHNERIYHVAHQQRWALRQVVFEPSSFGLLNVLQHVYVKRRQSRQLKVHPIDQSILALLQELVKRPCTNLQCSLIQGTSKMGHGPGTACGSADQYAYGDGTVPSLLRGIWKKYSDFAVWLTECAQVEVISAR